jgi:hypothetical protein
VDGAHDEPRCSAPPRSSREAEADAVIRAFDERRAARLQEIGEIGDVSVVLTIGNQQWPTLSAVRAGRVVKVNSQESVGSYGFQGYDTVLDTLVDQLTALGAR